MLFGSILAQVRKFMKKASIFILHLIVCSTVFAEEGQGSAEQGIFNGTFADALWTVVSFTALVIVLTKFAWKPLLSNLKARQEHITNQIQAADQTRQQAEQLLNDHKEQAIQIIKDTTDQAMLRSQQLVDKAQQQTLDIKRKSDEDVKNAMSIFSGQIWEQTEDIILNVGKEVLGRTITKEDNQRLIDEAVQKLRERKPA
jgi:F-type H+-transporting ATPase subunit b